MSGAACLASSPESSNDSCSLLTVIFFVESRIEYRDIIRYLVRSSISYPTLSDGMIKSLS
jgi:hypothetical protein